MSLPPLPPGATLDELPPLPPGATLDAPTPAPSPPSIQPAPSEPSEPGWFSPKSTSGTVLRGGAQGASYGFGDELSGAVASGVNNLTKAFSDTLKSMPGRALLRAQLGPESKNIPDAALDQMVDAMHGQAVEQVTGVKPGKGSAYEQARDSARRENAQSAEENPWTYGGAQLAGAMMTPGGPGKAKPLQTVGERALQLAGTGAKLGAVSALGASDADTAGGVALDTVEGGAMGGIGGALVGTGVDKGAAKFQQWLRQRAAEKAVAGVAPTAGLANRLRNKLGIASKDEIRGLGDKILAAKFLKPFGNARSALERVEGTLETGGENIGKFLDDADELVAQGVAPPARRELQQGAVDRALDRATDTSVAREEVKPVAAALSRRIGQDFKDPVELDPIERAMAAARGEIPEEAGKVLDGPPATYNELWKAKSQLQEALKTDELSNLSQRLYRKGVAGYTGGVYAQLEGALGPKAVEELRSEASRYGTAAQVEDLLREASSREAQRATVGLLDMQGGQLAQGALKNVPMAGPLAAFASSALRGRIDQTMAVGMKGSATALKQFGGNIAPALVGPGAQIAQRNAFQALADRWGINAKSKEELADEAFLKGQSAQ